MHPLDVGIIGAGTAGAAAALFLARAGHRVTVYERVPSPRAVGAGIILQPTGLFVLARLGLDAHVEERGAKLTSLGCETREGRSILDLSYASAGEGLAGLGVHRGVLFEALYGALVAEGIDVVTGVEIVDLEVATTPSGVARSRRSRRAGRWLVDTHGERRGPHELVVVADGARSQLRDDTGTSQRITPYPWGALWFVGCDRRDPSDPKVRSLHQVVDGTSRFVGLLPTGLGPGREPGEPRVSLFWSLRADALPRWRAEGLAAWKEEVSRVTAEAAPILAQIEAPEQVLFAGYHDVVMHRWSTRDVVYLGDAAHAMSPQLGQGANLALWDAMTLADVLAAEPLDLACALDAYSRARRDHLGVYQVVTRLLTPFFQGDEALLGALRDVGMPLLGALPFARRMMTMGMLGVLEGFVGGTLPLDRLRRAAGR